MLAHGRNLCQVTGQLKYSHRLVDKSGDTIDSLLIAKAAQASARRYLERTINLHGPHETITVDKSGTNTAAIHSANMDACLDIEIRQSNYFNNTVEQDPEDSLPASSF